MIEGMNSVFSGGHHFGVLSPGEYVILSPMFDSFMGCSVGLVSVFPILVLTVRIPTLVPESLMFHRLVLLKQGWICESFPTLFTETLLQVIMDSVNMLLQNFVLEHFVANGTLPRYVNPVVMLI